MKDFLITFFFWILVLTPETTLAQATKNEGDTYNFYFQKGPGPGSVTQTGSGGASASEPAAEKPSPPQGETKSVVAQNRENKESDHPVFELDINSVETKNRMRGYEIKSLISFAPNWGFQFGYLNSIRRNVSGPEYDSRYFTGQSRFDIQNSAISTGFMYSPGGWLGPKEKIRFGLGLGGQYFDTKAEMTMSDTYSEYQHRKYEPPKPKWVPYLDLQTVFRVTSFAGLNLGLRTLPSGAENGNMYASYLSLGLSITL